MTTQTEEATPQEVPEQEEYVWTVLRQRPAGYHQEGSPRGWDDVGTVVSDNGYWLGFDKERLAELARLGGGAGEYLCVCGNAAARVVIAAEQVYYRVTEES